MSTTRELSPPSLSSIEEEVVLTRPLSGWAVFALIVGLLSLFTPLSVNLVPLSILAIVVCAIVAFRLGRSESSSGAWMAVLGLGLSVASASWSLAAHKARNDYYSAAAGEFAAEYLNMLSQGMIYNALELKLPFAQRRTTDVDLQAYYEAYTGELNIDFSLEEVIEFDDSEPDNAEKARKTAVEKIKIDPVTQFARQYPNARWQPVEIRQVASKGQQAFVQVALANDEAPGSKVVINIIRNLINLDQVGPVAEWRITDQKMSN